MRPMLTADVLTGFLSVLPGFSILSMESPTLGGWFYCATLLGSCTVGTT